MSYLALDTKGDLARNYGAIASRYYGYKVSVIDLRNPTCSDGFNFMTLVNHYMDRAKRGPNDLTAKAKAENYAKILVKTIISPEGSSQYGDNAFFYESAEGVLAAIVMLLAEFILPEKDGTEKRHIVSAFKLVQDLLAAPGGGRGKNGFHVLMDMLPSVHKARWVAGAALTAADQAMASVMYFQSSMPFWTRSASRSSAAITLSTQNVLRRANAPSLLSFPKKTPRRISSPVS